MTSRFCLVVAALSRSIMPREASRIAPRGASRLSLAAGKRLVGDAPLPPSRAVFGKQRKPSRLSDVDVVEPARPSLGTLALKRELCPLLLRALESRLDAELDRQVA